MSETLRHVKSPLIVFRQLNSNMLKIRRTLRPKIHNDVQDSAASTAHCLCFGSRRELEMHPANCAFSPIVGNIRLRYDGLQAVGFELILAKSARKKSSRILPALEVNDKCALQFCFGEDHERKSPSFLRARYFVAAGTASFSADGSGIQCREAFRRPAFSKRWMWLIRK